MIRPDYYDKFRCIADKCDFTCCQEWKIAVDDATALKWKKIVPPEDVRTRRRNLEQFTQYKDGQRVISLEKQKCPFLSNDRLCRLVCQYGDEILSETCQIFPREIHKFDNRTEATLMPCCPEVIDLMNGVQKFKLTGLEELEQDVDNRLYDIRTCMISVFNDMKEKCHYQIMAIYYILLELSDKEELSVEEAFDSTPEVINIIRGMNIDRKESFEECNELFLDIIDNYIKQGLYTGFLEPLQKEAKKASHIEYSQSFMEQWEEYEALMHKYLAEEVYGDIINAESQMEDMVIRFQWIAMEYSLIRHMCFLHVNMNRQLTYVDMRSYIILASRIMGYEDQDIYEYLENSFEEMIWDWGYLALLVNY